MSHKRAQMWDQAIDRLQSVKGKSVRVHQSLSRSRVTGGHDRHFAATIQFSFHVNHVGWTISGGHLYLNGDDSWLGILLENVQEFTFASEGRFIVLERFENSTERITTIQVIE